jgi:spermidine synthase
MTDYKGDRQTSNLAAIHQQIHWLQQQPDGLLFQQNSDDNCIAVKKIKSVLLLLLAERKTLITNVAQSLLDFNNPLNLIFPYLRATLLALAGKN